MNRTLTNVFLHARNALPSRGIRPICWSCSVTQRHTQPSRYHILRLLPNTGLINVTTSIRYASTKLAKPGAKTQRAKKPATKKVLVKPRRSAAKKQRITTKAAKKKEKTKLKRKAALANKPKETIESVQALSLLRDKPRPKLTPSEYLREKRQAQESIEIRRIRKLDGKRNKARNDGKTVSSQPKTPIAKRKLPSARKAGIRVAPEGALKRKKKPSVGRPKTKSLTKATDISAHSLLKNYTPDLSVELPNGIPIPRPAPVTRIPIQYKYYIRRTKSNNFPVYNVAKRGGSQQITQIHHVEGDPRVPTPPIDSD